MPGPPPESFEMPYLPLLTEIAIHAAGQLAQGADILEIGGGASTLFYAMRANKILCIEHDPDWALLISASIPEGACDVEVECPGSPSAISTSIMKQPGESWDVVIVDCIQAARIPSIVLARSKVKPGGWMVVDDMNFKGITEATRQYLGHWTPTHVQGGKIHPLTGEWVAAPVSFFKKPGQA